MPTDPDLLLLAKGVLARNRQLSWDGAWDKRETDAKILSRGTDSSGTDNIVVNQSDDPFVPLSQPLGDGTSGQTEISGTELGTSGPYGDVFGALCDKCPEHVEPARWQEAVEGGRQFLASWGDQAHALGWTAQELFGLHPVPGKAHASFDRLSRDDLTGLVWLLRSRVVVKMTADSAAIRTASGRTLMYSKNNNPALGPFGDSLDEMGPI